MWWLKQVRRRRGGAAVDYQSVLNAAHVGARAGAQTKLDEDPPAAAAVAAQAYLDGGYPAGVPEGAAYEATLVDDDTTIRMVVTVPFQPLVGFLPMPATLQATSEMRVEDAI
jgi:hypothetical protein